MQGRDLFTQVIELPQNVVPEEIWDSSFSSLKKACTISDDTEAVAAELETGVVFS